MLNELKDKQKVEAVRRLMEIEYFPEHLKDFIINDTVYRTEPDGAEFFLSEEEKEIVKQFENEHNGLVFHLIHSFTVFGELYNILYVSVEKECWSEDFVTTLCIDVLVEEHKNYFEVKERKTVMANAFSYVKNISAPECSEFGTIQIQNKIGGLIRIC